MATGKDRKQKKRKRSTYAPDNPKQSRRFIEAAKKLGVDVDGKAFEDAMRALLKRKPKGGSN
jgi:hypothetical protein